MEESVQHDVAGSRFTLTISGAETYLRYSLRGTVMDTTSTFTPPAARGSGAASKVVRAALDHARAEGFTVVPSCWYVAGWIERHPEYEDLLA